MPRTKQSLSVMICLFVFAFVAGCSPAAGTLKKVPKFDENRAFELLKQQVDIGPRYPGSPGHAKTVDFIKDQLKPYADRVEVQPLTYRVNGKDIEMKNIVAAFNPSAKNWVLLAAHWDTRPIADHEVTADKKSQPILGANDAASGVAVLLELARLFAIQKPDVGVFMVFFDGEDFAINGEPPAKHMFVGSNYFAKNLDKCAVVDGKQIKFEYGILLDMIGDKDLRIPQEAASLAAAPDVVEKVWSMAKTMGYEDIFVPEAGMSISDDHIPLIQAGVKCIDLIDFEYAPWHTLEDTVDKCSAESLKVVGEVVAQVVYEEKGD